MKWKKEIEALAYEIWFDFNMLRGEALSLEKAMNSAKEILGR